MIYDFDRIIDRRSTNSIKWHWYPEEALPMWVADMDFASPEPVIRALCERVEHGIFGYERAPKALREVIAARLKARYDWDVPPGAIVFLPGVVPGFNLAVQAFVQSGQTLLFQTPVYPPILSAAETCGVQAHAMPLIRQPNGHYAIDFDLFAQALDEQARMFLLCNPHNPVGRVFRRDELAHVTELCLANNTLICSDEIHGDLIFSGHRHIPIATLAPEIEARTITLMAPSKTFNIAGLHCAFAVIPNPELRKRFKAARRGTVSSPNLLGYTAALAAYTEGQPWLDALLTYLEANRNFTYDYVRQHLPNITMARPEGTYLAWLDCRQADIPGNPHQFFLDQANVALNDGVTFGPDGAGFVRLNFGCPRSRLETGLSRMREALAWRNSSP